MSPFHSFLCSALLMMGTAFGSDTIRAPSEVIPGKIYRGGQPTKEVLASLKENGIKTILDLRNEDKLQIEVERAEVKKLGLNFISLPMRSLTVPSGSLINKIEFDILQNPDLQPIYVHCHHGEDRTGLVIGLYRVLVQKPSLTPEAAYREMLDNGFHPSLFRLKYTFCKYTGYCP